MSFRNIATVLSAVLLSVFVYGLYARNEGLLVFARRAPDYSSRICTYAGPFYLYEMRVEKHEICYLRTQG